MDNSWPILDEKVTAGLSFPDDAGKGFISLEDLDPWLL